MEITVRNLTNYRKVSYVHDGYHGEIHMYGDGFANCQVAPIAYIEDLLDCEDESFVVKVLRKLCLGYKNIVVIDIDNGYLKQVNNLLKNNIINNFL